VLRQRLEQVVGWRSVLEGVFIVAASGVFTLPLTMIARTTNRRKTPNPLRRSAGANSSARTDFPEAQHPLTPTFNGLPSFLRSTISSTTKVSNSSKCPIRGSMKLRTPLGGERRDKNS